MKKEKNLDELFREKLLNYEQNPPVGLLDNVLAGAASARKKRTLIYWRTLSVAAALLLAFIAGWQFNFRNDKGIKHSELVNGRSFAEITKDTIKQANEKLVSSSPSTFKSSQENNQVAITKEQAVKHSITKGFPSKSLIKEASTQKTSITQSDLAQRNSEQKESESISLIASVKQSDWLKPMKSLYHIIEQTKAENELQERKAEEARVLRVEKSIDQQIMERNQKEFLAENSLRERSRWLVGAQLSPVFSVDRSSHSQVYASSMINSESNNPVAMAGGISVEYKTKRRLSIQSGVYYSGIDQSSGNSPITSGNDYMYASLSSGYFNTPVNIDPGTSKVSMNSSAGVIELNGIPSSVILGTNIENNTLDTKAVMLSDVQFIQNFEYLEIPLYLRYTLIDARFGVEMLGGFSTNFLIGNNTYLQSSSGRSLAGTTQDMQALNYSGTLGVGLRYSLSKHFFLNVEPRFKYFLNSLSYNSAVNYKPYTFGIFTGVSYEF